MKLYRLILPVLEIDKAAQFYAALFQDSGIRVSPGRHYFNLGGTILACYDPIADGDDPQPDWQPHFNQYVYFAVSELQKVLGRLKSLDARYSEIQAEEMPWGENLFYFDDPWGNHLCMVDEKTVFMG